MWFAGGRHARRRHPDRAAARRRGPPAFRNRQCGRHPRGRCAALLAKPPGCVHARVHSCVCVWESACGRANTSHVHAEEGSDTGRPFSRHPTFTSHAPPHTVVSTLPHSQAALAEISRVLRPGGVFVASTFLNATAPLGQILGNDEILRPLNQVGALWRSDGSGGSVCACVCGSVRLVVCRRCSASPPEREAPVGGPPAGTVVIVKPSPPGPYHNSRPPDCSSTLPAPSRESSTSGGRSRS